MSSQYPQNNLQDPSQEVSNALSSSNLARRIIPCLDVANGKVIKGQKFLGHEIVGEITDLAIRYRDQGADELVFYDITASPEGRNVDVAWVQRVAKILDIPFSVAGGIRSLEIAEKVLAAGADKISINSPAIERPELINELVDRFGSQCIVIGIDSVFMHGDWFIKQYTGDPKKIRDAGRRTLDWVKEVEQRGAGEIVLNCMSQDGMKNGYDIQQLSAVRAITSLPLIASGGAGLSEHFKDVFLQADVDGALAASVFHKGLIPIPKLKEYLRLENIKVRKQC